MSGSQRTPPKVNKRIAGSRQLKRSLLEKKLGRNAFTAWVALLWRRDKHGRTFATNKTIVSAARLSANQVHRAMVKLCRAGLVVPLSWTQNGRGKKQARLVKGDYRDGVVLVPSGAEKALRKLGRGGRRANAGRPSANVTIGRRATRFENEFKASRSPIQSVTHSNQSVTLSPCSSDRIPKVNEGIQTAEKDPIDLKRGTKFPSGGTDVPPERNLPRASRGPVFDLSLSAFERLGIPPSCTDPAILGRLLAPGGPFVPPFVTTEMMCTPRLPSPPLLSDGLDEEQSARRLVHCFRGAVASRTKEPCFILARCELRRSRYYRTLVDAAQAFRENEVAPAAWAAFSCDVWEHYSAKRRKVPPINWVFSESRIDERLGWFRREEGGYSGGRLLFSEEQSELLRRVDAVRKSYLRVLQKEERAGCVVNAALFASVGCDLLEEWLPGGFQDWLDRARHSGEKDRKRIRAMVDQGDFVWD